MVFLSILEFSLRSTCRYMRSAMSPTTATMKTAPVGATSKARPPPGGKAPGISAVIKATERAGACSWLSVKSRRPMGSAAVIEVAVADVTVIEAAVADVTVAEITVMEPLVTKVSTVRNEGVMVEECSTVMPVVPPVAPAPPKASEEADTKSNTKGKADAAPKNPGHGIPARVGNDGRPVHQPRIIGRHVHHLRVGRFDDDRVALSRYLILLVAIQMAGIPSLLTQRLDGIRHILRLGGICLAKR